MERDWGRLKRWIVRRRLQGWSVTRICGEARVSRDMFYRWWNRYRAEGWSGLEEKPRGRPRGPGIDGGLRGRIVRLRERYGWGPNKIAGCLRHRGFRVDHNVAYRVIREKGLNNPVDRPRKTWGKKRFERDRSNGLWQADFKPCRGRPVDDLLPGRPLTVHHRLREGLEPYRRKRRTPPSKDSEKIRHPRTDTDRPGDTVQTRQGRTITVHKVLHRARSTAHHRKQEKTDHHRKDRGIPQSLHERSPPLQEALDIHTLLQLHKTTRITKLFNTSNNLPQRHESVRQFLDRTGFC